jgi:hypothetical protein
MDNPFTNENGFNTEVVDFLINTYEVTLHYNPDTNEVRATLPPDTTPDRAALIGVTFGVNLPDEDYDMMGVESRIDENGCVELWGVLE